ncbi:hypothetical protein XM38_039970 [Halomicronema hongdechloris C2206]|uniref:Baseplate assembly protein n=1 Tax=Halomicronema hongdechloris C2206 TaxID=1641165 RepID=A0A1Z3HRW5_9CYAN|nr:hypothetical protein [Halomicronema hongdechloris]ASC73035.1 hypothetical protein XM38_039970 [Halomicronema hongdechloris C2206]
MAGEHRTIWWRCWAYRLSPWVWGAGPPSPWGIQGDEPVAIPAGLGLKAQVEGLAKAADFQTTTEVTAYPHLSQFHLYRPFQLPRINTGTTQFSVRTVDLKNTGVDLNPGDRLFLVDVPSQPQTKRQIGVIQAVRERFDRTEIIMEGSWQQGDAQYRVSAYKLGRSFRHFGYNSPPEFVRLNSDGTAVSEVVDFSRSLQVENPNDSLAENTDAPAYAPLANPRAIPLESQVDDLSIGTPLLIQLILNRKKATDGKSVGGSTYFFARAIQAVFQASLTQGAISGGTTVVALTGQITTGDKVLTDIRSVELLEVIGQPFTLAGAYQEKSAADPKTLYFFGDGAAYRHLHQRPLALVNSVGHTELLTAVLPTYPPALDKQVKLRPVYLPDLKAPFTLADFPLLNPPSTTVYGNLLAATQGKPEQEAVLGNGDSRQAFQTFKLPNAPLTYLNSAGDTPPEVPELAVYVDNRQWTRVSSFFGQAPTAEVYIVREDAQGRTVGCSLGDGKTGARLPSGIKNIRAQYRTGNGAYGPLKLDTKVQATDRLPRLDQLWLPGVASGGTEPESGDNAKLAAPGQVQSLGRLVSLQDFETEALGIAGVAKAVAAWQRVDNVPAVVLTVLMETGRAAEVDQVRTLLNTYNRCRGPQRFPVLVQAGQRRYLYLRLVTSLDPAMRPELLTQAIHTALGVGKEGRQGLLALSQRRFGQPEYASRIEATVQQVEGVIWTQVKALGWFPATDAPTELTYPMAESRLSLVPCGADQLLALQPQHLQLQCAAAPQEAC